MIHNWKALCWNCVILTERIEQCQTKTYSQHRVCRGAADRTPNQYQQVWTYIRPCVGCTSMGDMPKPFGLTTALSSWRSRVVGRAEREYLGCGPQINEQGDYQHSLACSGSGRHPRRPGNSCSCHRCDLFHQRLDMIRQENGDVTRTLRVATCPECHKRTEYPLPDEAPREVFCLECEVWAPVKELSWTGEDFAKLLPPRKERW